MWQYIINRNVIIGSIYHTKINSFNENLEILIENIYKEKKYAYLIGDYNINIAYKENNWLTQRVLIAM